MRYSAEEIEEAIINTSLRLTILQSTLAPEPKGKKKIILTGLPEWAPGKVYEITVPFPMNTITASIQSGSIMIWEGTFPGATDKKPPFPPAEYYFPPQGTYTVPFWSSEPGVITIAVDPSGPANVNARGYIHLQGW